MKKLSEKTLIIIAIAAMLLGGSLYVIGSKFHVTKVHNSDFVTNSYTITDSFSSISLDISNARIVFEPSAGNTIQVICNEVTEDLHKVFVNNDTLIINSTAKYTKIGFEFLANTETPTITLVLPQGEYNKLTIDSDTGSITIPQAYRFSSIDIKSDTGSLNCQASASNEIRCKFNTGVLNLSNLNVGMLYLEGDTGKIKLDNITCNGDIDADNDTGVIEMEQVTCSSLTCDNNTGSIILSDVVCLDYMQLQTDTGKIDFEDCDAKTVDIESDTGSINGHFLSGKTYNAKSDLGSVHVPENSGSGHCNVSSDTGSINIY